MGDENENKALQILEGLATGKQHLAQILTHLISSNQENHNHDGNNSNGGTNRNHMGNDGVGGSNGKKGNHAGGSKNDIPAHMGTITTDIIILIPLMPQFLGNQKVRNQGKQDQGETFDDYWKEYQAMGEDFLGGHVTIGLLQYQVQEQAKGGQ